MKQIKSLIPIIIALILLVSVVLGLNLIRRASPQTIESKADVSYAVSFSPKVLTGQSKDSEFSLDVVLTTGGKLVSGVDLELKYPDNLKLLDFKPDVTSSGLEVAVIPGNPDNFSNVLRYVGVNKAGNLPVRSTLKLGTLKFQVLKDGSSKVEYTKAIITIPGEERAVEPTLGFGTYLSGSPTPSVSPSGSPMVCPSPPICGPGLLVKAVIPQLIAGSPPQCTQYSCEGPAAPACLNGAVKGNRCVSNIDFVEWFKEWSGVQQTKNADFYPECNAQGTRGDGEINIADFEVWRRESTGVNKCQ